MSFDEIEKGIKLIKPGTSKSIHLTKITKILMMGKDIITENRIVYFFILFSLLSCSLQRNDSYREYSRDQLDQEISLIVESIYSTQMNKYKKLTEEQKAEYDPVLTKGFVLRQDMNSRAGNYYSSIGIDFINIKRWIFYEVSDTNSQSPLTGFLETDNSYFEYKVIPDARNEFYILDSFNEITKKKFKSYFKKNQISNQQDCFGGKRIVITSLIKNQKKDYYSEVDFKCVRIINKFHY